MQLLPGRMTVEFSNLLTAVYERLHRTVLPADQDAREQFKEGE